MTDAERFKWQQYIRRYTQFDPKTGCWMWQRSRILHGGYGQVSIARWYGLSAYAHRLAYAVFIEPIPKGLMLRHQCHTPACCNPAHFLTGTMLDNRADDKRDGRKMGQARLTAKQVQAIKRLRGRHTQKDIGAMFGVAVSTINCIFKGRTWTHVP